jgi:hypothetical protein
MVVTSARKLDSSSLSASSSTTSRTVSALRIPSLNSCKTVKFWYGSGSENPYLMDPDQDADPDFRQFFCF